MRRSEERQGDDRLSTSEFFRQLITSPQAQQPKARGPACGPRPWPRALAAEWAACSSCRARLQCCPGPSQRVIKWLHARRCVMRHFLAPPCARHSMPAPTRSRTHAHACARIRSRTRTNKVPTLQHLSSTNPIPAHPGILRSRPPSASPSTTGAALRRPRAAAAVACRWWPHRWAGRPQGARCTPLPAVNTAGAGDNALPARNAAAAAVSWEMVAARMASHPLRHFHPGGGAAPAATPVSAFPPRQVVSDYLTAYDTAGAMMEARGRPVVVYTYRMAFRRPPGAAGAAGAARGSIA